MKHRLVLTNEQAVALGFANIASYRAAVRVENEREARRAYAEDVAKRQASLTAKLQPPGSGTQIKAQLVDDLQRHSANLERRVWTEESPPK